ncbi:MAG: hypothetical protein KDA84_16530 [Planctomycetaceae bacterium]|nr:hypothetical protein [Planctomycetaceae bacterium]
MRHLEELPDPDTADKEHWDFLVECLEGTVLWDDEFDANHHIDNVPERFTPIGRCAIYGQNRFVALTSAS